MYVSKRRHGTVTLTLSVIEATRLAILMKVYSDQLKHDTYLAKQNNLDTSQLSQDATLLKRTAETFKEYLERKEE